MSTREHPEHPAPKIHYQCYQNIINETLQGSDWFREGALVEGEGAWCPTSLRNEFYEFKGTWFFLYHQQINKPSLPPLTQAATLGTV